MPNVINIDSFQCDAVSKFHGSTLPHFLLESLMRNSKWKKCSQAPDNHVYQVYMIVYNLVTLYVIYEEQQWLFPSLFSTQTRRTYEKANWALLHDWKSHKAVKRMVTYLKTNSCWLSIERFQNIKNEVKGILFTVSAFYSEPTQLVTKGTNSRFFSVIVTLTRRQVFIEHMVLRTGSTDGAEAGNLISKTKEKGLAVCSAASNPLLCVWFRI